MTYLVLLSKRGIVGNGFIQLGHASMYFSLHALRHTLIIGELRIVEPISESCFSELGPQLSEPKPAAHCNIHACQ